MITNLIIIVAVVILLVYEVFSLFLNNLRGLCIECRHMISRIRECEGALRCCC